MAKIQKHTFMALAGLTLAGCGVVVNGYPPPNQPPQVSSVNLPDQMLTVGRPLTISRAENLFADDDSLTLAAISSDTVIVAVSVSGEGGSYSLTFDPRSPGTAEVDIVATEPESDGSDDDQQPQGRSVTRTVGVTVVAGASQ